MANSALITAIVPVYGAEQYLPQCIESILEQTYTNLDVILVDDGSPDKCGEICDEYAINDTRIKVIHKENGGVADARNAGLDVATGKYVTFIDCDDWIAPDMIETLYSNLTNYGADIACCGHYKAYINRNVPPVKLSTEHMVLKNEQVADMLFASKLNNIIWGKLYIKAIFDTVRFPVGIVFDDVATAFDIYMSAGKIVYIPELLYYWRKRKISQTRETDVFGKLLLKIDAYEERHKRIEKKYPQYTLMSEAVLCLRYMHLAEDIIFSKYGNYVDKSKLNIDTLMSSTLLKIKSILKRQLRSSHLILSYKIKLCSLVIHPRLYRLVLSCEDISRLLRRKRKSGRKYKDIARDADIMFD